MTFFNVRPNNPYESLESPQSVLAWGMTTAELFFWAGEKRNENLRHRAHGDNFCRQCDNPLDCAGAPRFRCLCGAGKKMVTPYRIRWFAKRDREHDEAGHVYCLEHQVYEARGPHGGRS